MFSIETSLAYRKEASETGYLLFRRKCQSALICFQSKIKSDQGFLCARCFTSIMSLNFPPEALRGIQMSIFPKKKLRLSEGEALARVSTASGSAAGLGIKHSSESS